MRIFLIITLVLSSNLIFSQNFEIEADYELQGILKNYKAFNFDSLKTKKFNYIKGFDDWSSNKIIERKIDFGWEETIYSLTTNYSVDRIMRIARYRIHVFKENDSIVGLISYNEIRMKKDYYFNYDKLKKYINTHNQFYHVESDIETFINQNIMDETYGDCGNVIYEIPRYNDLLYNDIKNLPIFESWIKSYNVELQSNAVKAYEFLIKNNRVNLNDDLKKIIKQIKERNSMISICSGCLVLESQIF